MLCGHCKCSHIDAYAALSKSPHALADGLILVFNHPVTPLSIMAGLENQMLSTDWPTSTTYTDVEKHRAKMAEVQPQARKIEDRVREVLEIKRTCET